MATRDYWPEQIIPKLREAHSSTGNSVVRSKILSGARSLVTEETGQFLPDLPGRLGFVSFPVAERSRINTQLTSQLFLAETDEAPVQSDCLVKGFESRLLKGENRESRPFLE